jgi:predicted nuclease of predicted toxin-antitoxin system
VRFLVDNQLPAALARWLTAEGHDAIHVLDIALAQADDSSICDFARAESRVVVSKDEDYLAANA